MNRYYSYYTARAKLESQPPVYRLSVYWNAPFLHLFLQINSNIIQNLTARCMQGPMHVCICGSAEQEKQNPLNLFEILYVRTEV